MHRGAQSTFLCETGGCKNREKVNKYESENAHFKKRPFQAALLSNKMQCDAAENQIVRVLHCNERSSWMNKLCEHDGNHSLIETLEAFRLSSRCRRLLRTGTSLLHQCTSSCISSHGGPVSKRKLDHVLVKGGT